MTQGEFIKVLDDWNFWHKELDCGIEREFYLKKLQELVRKGFCTVVTGPRRVGKTYIMRQFLKKLINLGVSPRCTLFINFEDPRLTELNLTCLRGSIKHTLKISSQIMRSFFSLMKYRKLIIGKSGF